MRYALRNKDKISAHFEPHGQEILNRIELSLKTHFERHEDPLTLFYNEVQHPDEKYKTIIINDEGHSCACIAFYVINIQFDVVRLAFQEFIG